MYTEFWWGNLRGKKTLVRSTHSWKDIITMGLQEVGCGGGMDWIDLAQDRDRWQAR